MQRLIITVLLCSQLQADTFVPYEAVVITPVADVLWRPAFKVTSKDIAKKHETLPFSPEKPRAACLRSHQLKKNERVTVIALVGEEAKCETYSFMIRKGSLKSTFWTLKRNLASLSDLQKKGIQLPPAIDARKKPHEYNACVVTLLEPWYDADTSQLYSVGTRFLHCPKEDTLDRYGVYNFTAELTKKRSLVPKKGARISYAQNHSEAREPFLDLLRAWACVPKAAVQSKQTKPAKKSGEKLLCIPYVHGGCSFRGRSEANGFYESACYVDGKKLISWRRIGNYQTPLDGFDCASMILCAAQIVGMPYYWKNTSMLVKGLRELREGESIEEGDLIWYHGHVMVVSDLKNNLLLEAAGYDKGYGKLHEIFLAKVFKGISTYDDLAKAALQKKSVHRLTSKGRVCKSFSRVKILKLSSLWEDGSHEPKEMALQKANASGGSLSS